MQSLRTSSKSGSHEGGASDIPLLFESMRDAKCLTLRVLLPRWGDWPFGWRSYLPCPCSGLETHLRERPAFSAACLEPSCCGPLTLRERSLSVLVLPVGTRVVFCLFSQVCYSFGLAARSCCRTFVRHAGMAPRLARTARALRRIVPAGQHPPQGRIDAQGRIAGRSDSRHSWAKELACQRASKLEAAAYLTNISKSA